MLNAEYYYTALVAHIATVDKLALMMHNCQPIWINPQNIIQEQTLSLQMIKCFIFKPGICMTSHLRAKSDDI